MARKIRSTIADEELLSRGRERIARDAIKVIVKNGYANTTTRQIADACGMSEGALYHYVGTKSDILHLVTVVVDGFHVKFREFVKGLKKISQTEALCECWRYYLSMVDREQDTIMIMHRETISFHPKDRNKRLTVDPQGMRVFEKVLREGVESGEFVCDDPKLMAYDMWLIAHNWAFERWLLRRHFTLEQYTEWHLENFLRLLGVSVSQMETDKKVMN